MVALSELPAVEGGHEEKNNKMARLEQEIISLRRKLADEKKKKMKSGVARGCGQRDGVTICAGFV